MRVCYLLQTHTAPSQIARLAHTIKRSSPEARVFIAHDACRRALDPARFAGLEGVTVLNRSEPVERGRLSMLEPWFAAAERLSAEPDWEWLPASTPPLVRDVLRRCLVRDLRYRIQAIGAVRIALD